MVTDDSDFDQQQLKVHTTHECTYVCVPSFEIQTQLSRFCVSQGCTVTVLGEPSGVFCRHGCKDSSGNAVDSKMCGTHSLLACCHNKLWTSCSECSGPLTSSTCMCVRLHRELHFGSDQQPEYEVHALLGVRSSAMSKLEVKVQWRNGVQTWAPKEAFAGGNCNVLLRKLHIRLRMDHRPIPSLCALLSQLQRMSMAKP